MVKNNFVTNWIARASGMRKRSRTEDGPTGIQKKYKRTKLLRRRVTPRTGQVVGDGVFRPPASSFGTSGYQVQAPMRRVTLRYADEIAMDPGATGANTNHVFSANGAFDPDVTTTGHQPKGFDQLSPLYDRYCVTASRIKITPRYATLGVPSHFFIHFSNSTSDNSIDLLSEALESPNRSRELFSGGGDTNEHSATLGVDIQQYTKTDPMKDDAMHALISANPDREYFYNVNMIPVGQVDGTDGELRYVTVEIEYDCVFFDPRILAQS